MTSSSVLGLLLPVIPKEVVVVEKRDIESEYLEMKKHYAIVKEGTPHLWTGSLYALHDRYANHFPEYMSRIEILRTLCEIIGEDLLSANKRDLCLSIMIKNTFPDEEYSDLTLDNLMERTNILALLHDILIKERASIGKIFNLLEHLARHHLFRSCAPTLIKHFVSYAISILQKIARGDPENDTDNHYLEFSTCSDFLIQYFANDTNNKHNATQLLNQDCIGTDNKDRTDDKDGFKHSNLNVGDNNDNGAKHDVVDNDNTKNNHDDGDDGDDGDLSSNDVEGCILLLFKIVNQSEDQLIVNDAMDDLNEHLVKSLVSKRLILLHVARDPILFLKRSLQYVELQVLNILEELVYDLTDLKQMELLTTISFEKEISTEGSDKREMINEDFYSLIVKLMDQDELSLHPIAGTFIANIAFAPGQVAKLIERNILDNLVHDYTQPSFERNYHISYILAILNILIFANQTQFQTIILTYPLIPHIIANAIEITDDIDDQTQIQTRIHLIDKQFTNQWHSNIIFINKKKTQKIIKNKSFFPAI